MKERQVRDRFLGKMTNIFSDERGFTLVESLVALAILGTAFVAFLAGLSSSAIATNRMDKRTTAGIVARSQMEYTKAQEYRVAPATYDTFSPLPAGYSVVAEASTISGRDDDVQKVTVTASHKGEALYVLEDFKANR